MNADQPLMRRVAGRHNLRLDGIYDLMHRARGASVLDIGCNRGAVAYEFAQNGATLCHGCDIYEPGIAAAREFFTDLREVKSQFEVVDLTKPEPLKVFGDQRYDIVVMLATYHKLKRIMAGGELAALMRDIADRTVKWFGYKGLRSHNESVEEIEILDAMFKPKGLERVQTSFICREGPTVIWQRT